MQYLCTSGVCVMVRSHLAVPAALLSTSCVPDLQMYGSNSWHLCQVIREVFHCPFVFLLLLLLSPFISGLSPRICRQLKKTNSVWYLNEIWIFRSRCLAVGILYIIIIVIIDFSVLLLSLLISCRLKKRKKVQNMKRMFWSVLILFPWYIYIWELKAACTSLKTVLCYSWCHNWFASSRTWSWRVIPLNMMCQASATLFCRLVSVIVVFFFLSSSFLSSMGERCSVVSYLSFSCWIMGFTLLSSGIWGHKIGERKKTLILQRSGSVHTLSPDGSFSAWLCVCKLWMNSKCDLLWHTQFHMILLHLLCLCTAFEDRELMELNMYIAKWVFVFCE